MIKLFTNLVKSLLDYKFLTWNLMQFIKCIKNSLRDPKLAKTFKALD